MSSFDAIYVGTPPWDIGRPQKEMVRLEDEGQIAGKVLEVGCGTGENALFLAGRGHEVWGIDFASPAIEKAKKKAAERRISATFLVKDALNLLLNTRFDTVVDIGLFHVFTDDERPRFSQSLAKAVRQGGRYFMLCFSELEPGRWGPRRVTQDEIRSTFAKGWKIDYINAARFETNFPAGDVSAWLSSITRVNDDGALLDRETS